MATMRPSDDELLDGSVLVLRQNVGFDFLDAKLAGNRFGRRLVVAGQHHDTYAVVPKSIECCQRRCLDRIGNGDDAAWLMVDGKKQGSRAVATKLVGLPVEIVEFYAEVSHQLSALPSATGLPSILPVTPLPVTEAKSVGSWVGTTAIFRGHDDGGGKWVFARLL